MPSWKDPACFPWQFLSSVYALIGAMRANPRDNDSRFLKSFVEIRREELYPSFLFFSFWFLTIVVFQTLRPLKKGLFVDELGAYLELYAKLANIAVALLLVVLFTVLYNRLGSRKLIWTLTAVFGIALLLFSIAFQAGRSGSFTIWSFYLFGDSWSTVWVTTFWAYLNEMTVPQQSKRLYGIIGAGAVTGGLVANLAVLLFVEEGGAPIFLLACAVMTAIMALITHRTEALASRPDSPIGRRNTDRLGVALKSEKKVNAALEGARLVGASKYLTSVVAIVFLYELVSQILDYQVSTAAEAIQGVGGTQAFYGQLGSIVGVLSLITQLFLVSFVVRRFGMTAALLVLPLALSLASGIYLAVPILLTAGLLFVADGSFAYSINQTAREMLLVPTSSDVKYKARAFTNMFVQRTGKGAAILMALGLVFLPVRFLSILALVVIVVWIGVASYAGRRFDKLTQEDS